jgi:prolyl-tRNA editing enzyme YbaK/EbsC (Cys-tRNA(Pro) deacylase)
MVPPHRLFEHEPQRARYRRPEGAEPISSMQATGTSQIARDAGLRRESLYKTLSAEGKPEFATIMKVIAALELQLHASPSRTAA